MSSEKYKGYRGPGLDALKAQLSNEEALSARVKQLPIY